MSEKKSSFNKEDLLACSRGEMFGPGNSQLPAPNMLIMDRVVSITEDGGEHERRQLASVRHEAAGRRRTQDAPPHGDRSNGGAQASRNTGATAPT